MFQHTVLQRTCRREYKKVGQKTQLTGRQNTTCFRILTYGKYYFIVSEISDIETTDNNSVSAITF
ncbi:hypothetical protein Pan241w_09300 [Gimesia alba]|uniref:Uncharacterized protein n=1 Tax=Gimesia alba TaxID=2527973 RepID=A0A517RAJ0_9PLAN|nr:hypothetical protein Pan241w_09300 [Gimesia alba]